MSLKIALILSVILQFATAIIAMTLIRRTRSNIAWWLISFGFLLMAIRRLFELMQIYSSNIYLENSLINSWIGVLISVVMLVSLSFIKRIFNIQQRFEELKKKNEARLFSSIIRTEENQRIKFSKELHDGLGPLLSSVKMSVSALVHGYKEKDKSEILANTEKLIDESIRTVKDISNQLSPHVLNNFGLQRAIQSFIHKLNTDDLPLVEMNSDLAEKRYARTIETVVYRVVCELINNTIKHAKARHIYIDLIEQKNALELKYMDDGVGIEMQYLQETAHGMGLNNITSRIKSVNGYYEIYTSQGEGFTFIATILL